MRREFRSGVLNFTGTIKTSRFAGHRFMFLTRYATVLLLFFCIHAPGSHAQEFQVPSYFFQKPEDFARHRDEVVRGMRWLLEHPVSAQVEKRREVSAFVMSWLAGTEEVSLVLKPEIVGDLLEDRGFLFTTEFLVIYMSSMALEYLQADDQPEAWQVQMAGADALIDAYRFVKNSSRSDHIHRLELLRKDGKLEDWVKEVVTESPPTVVKHS